MKKGFTLVEMIGIIIILSVILLVTVPTMIGTLKNSNQKRFDSFKKNLKLVTENYIVEHKKTSESSISITLQNLLDEHYIDEIPAYPNENPKEAGIDISGACVVATKDEGSKLFSFKLCKENCDSAPTDCENLE